MAGNTDSKARALITDLGNSIFLFHHFAHNCILLDFKVYYEFMLQRGYIMA